MGIAMGQQQDTPARAKIRNERYLFARVALTTSICLLLNVAATLSTLTSLDEWSRTTDLSLACFTDETWLSRDLNAYGFSEQETVSVCGAENVVQSQHPCKGECMWNPTVFIGESAQPNVLWCETEVMNTDAGHLFWACDCPCKDLVEIHRPRCLFFLNQCRVVQTLMFAFHPPNFAACGS
jgi:hypothetical protein